MKKNASIVITLVFIGFILFCGCDKNSKIDNSINKETTISVDDIYMSVLKSEKKYISEDENELYFYEYMKDLGVGNRKIEYALFDFDRDGENEMVIRIGTLGYLILNYEDEKVYGFQDVYRGMGVLKEDGTYVGSGGADAHVVCRSTFKKNKRINEEIAASDWGKYTIGGKSVTKAEYDELYDKECLSKKDPMFVTYMEQYNYENK